MSNESDHIKVLKDLATLSPDEFTSVKGQYLVKTTARDVIEAGRRLEELGIFNFESNKNEIKITVEYVSTNVSTNVKPKDKSKKDNKSKK